MKKSKIWTADGFGVLSGIVLFLIMIPLGLFISAVPSYMLSTMVENEALGMAINVVVMAITLSFTLAVAMIIGFTVSHGLSWFWRILGIPEALSHMKSNNRPIDAYQRINFASFGGIGVALVLFFFKGAAPIYSLTTKVEHLFPRPIVLPLGFFWGDSFSVNVSHAYAVTTGFLGIGFLFVIAGIVIGSLLALGIKLLIKLLLIRN